VKVPDGHASAARNLVEVEPAELEDGPPMGGQLQRLCRAAQRDLTASGVGVSVMSQSGGLMTAAASSAISAGVEELQLTLGEGPCLTACATGRPLHVPNLEETDAADWPAYVPAALAHGVRAVFSFPLQAGTARVGALDVYRESAGALSDWATARAAGYAEVALDTILGSGRLGADDADGLMDNKNIDFEVYQAQGMVMVQLTVSPDVALARMRGFAFAENRSLREVAEDVIARRLVLEPDMASSDPPEE
jgi:hypothetical protein